MAREKKFSTDDIYLQTHNLLIKEGYEKFSFSLLAKSLKVSRAAIYKYYTNKDELISDYLVGQMKQMMEEFHQINLSLDFTDQFDQLFELIFKYREVHLISNALPHDKMVISTEKQKQKELISGEVHGHFFNYIQQFIQTGKTNGYIKKEIPDSLIVGIIFHSINIPDHSNLSSKERAYFIKMIIKNGIFDIPK
ncbi:transcriptional regulator, TetR family [Carnobacterium sp. 17-4]|uniref:TetR/AcrR family transcriptional regulator n=1 Tax=Carnobacterium sp. (strain 17-4) TaxID=208596 RepID=UPI000205883F|nr:TetR/AcrR family transcriptional regulator [Carnobacterium sp. 17-4]AEB30569.1 transcriptional regulator, TetR family [Carnobacterium sp. 17-4]